MKNQGIKKYSSVVLAALLCSAVGVVAEETDRILALEKQMDAMKAEISSLKSEERELSFLEKTESKLHLGGYGEIHANFQEGGSDQFDIHRLVMYAGYDFNDWIKLSSEVELEHAFVADSDDGSNGGEISVEQLFVDFMLADAVNVRAGRVLAPLGIINQKHEPTLFLGVERPNMEKNIIPSTWSLDGIGIFGFPLSWLSYEAYVVAGLDGSEFRAKDGVREGRIKERASFNDAAVTGRLDFYPFVDADLPGDQDLRVGISGYYGGTDNSNGGGDNGVDNTFSMYSADFEYDISRFRFRGVVAYGENSDADDLQDEFGRDAGKEIFGWYLEGGVSVMPESWKKGKLVEADIIPFIRYEEYDTQYEVSDNVADTGEFDRSEVTLGVNVPLTSQFVVKADYQFMDNEGPSDGRNQFNLGMGWVFQ
jgi:hypothetical protein